MAHATIRNTRPILEYERIDDLNKVSASPNARTVVIGTRHWECGPPALADASISRALTMTAPPDVRNAFVDVAGMKRVVAGWIDGLTVSGLSLPDQLRMDLQRAADEGVATIQNDGGEYCIEIGRG